MARRNNSRSSAMSMARCEAPIISTLNFSSTPSRTRSSAVLSAVWPPMVGKSALGPLLLDDARDGAPVDRLDINRIGALRVGHDGGRIGVHQNDPITLFFQCFTRLSSRIIELTGLTDNDRPRADDQDAVDVGSLGHAFAYPSAVFCLATLRLREFACMRLTMRYMKCSNSRRRSCGPGLASGCP